MSPKNRKITLHITSIDSRNQSSFKDFAPTNYTNMLKDANTFALGAAYKLDNQYTACGLIIFSVEKSVKLEWIYVGELFRLRRVGDALMNKLFDIVGTRPIEVRFPSSGEYDSLYYFFQNWAFIFHLENHFKLDITLGEIRNNHQLTGTKLRQSALAAFHKGTIIQLSELTNDIWQKLSSLLTKVGLSPLKGTYEQSVSALVLDSSGKHPAFLLLFVKHDTNVIDLVYFNKIGSSEPLSPLLLLCFSVLMSKSYSDDTVISIAPKSELTGKLLDTLFPAHHPGLVRVGVLESDML